MKQDLALELTALAPALAGQEMVDGWEAVTTASDYRVLYHARRGVYYREFTPRGALGRLGSLIRGGRPARERKGNAALLFAGIEAPENLAWGKLPGGGQYLFTRAWHGRRVSQWLSEALPTGSSAHRANRWRLLRELGRHIGRLHATGFVPGDLCPGNVLAHWRGDRFTFCLLDNERTLRTSRPSGRQLLRNLVQLNRHCPNDLSRTDRWRFFCAWRSQLRELSEVESRVLATEAYRRAMLHPATRGGQT